MAAEPDDPRRDIFRVVAFALLGFGAAATIVCMACVLHYRALEHAPSNGSFLTLFALDAAHDRAVASGVVAVVLLLAGSVLAVVSRRRQPAQR